MDEGVFTSTRAGRLTRVGRGEAAYLAFVPAPIPRELHLDPDLIVLLSEADQALGRLASLATLLPNPHILIQPYVRREAVASTRIEGTQSSLSDVLAAEAQLLAETPDRREVFNYVRALEYGLRRLESLPLSNRLVREMHEELMRGVRGEERTPGEFRRSQNWIGGRSPGDAVFVPPPVAELQDALADLERFLHQEPTLPILVRCALLHYQFETIHPFLDGNGRLGRLLIVFYLVERQALTQPLLYLSSYFERNRGEYAERLQRVREHGDYEGWIRFFLVGVASESDGATRSAHTLIALAASFRERLRVARVRGQAVDAAETLIANPFVSAPQLARTLGMSRQGAAYVIRALERAGVVQPVARSARSALYVAPEVLEALESGS